MNRFKIKFPRRRSQTAKDPTEKTRAIAERLYRNRQVMKRSGSAEDDWAKAERIVRSPVRRLLLHLNQPLIHIEKRAIEPTARWVDRADLFRIIERLSPTLEALGVIAIPLVLFFAAQSYEESLRQQELEQLQQQAVTDYLNQLSTILLELDGSLGDPQNAELRTLTTATTLTLLRDPNLDGNRKGQIIGFLSEMRLVQRKILYGPQRPEDTVPLIRLRSADLVGVDLRNADLSGADLSHADLSHASLIFVDLSGADLSHADLRNADLIFVDLSHADLIFVDLRNADLRNAGFVINGRGGADLRGADLRGADLRGADLRGVDLHGADLRRTNLSNADLREIDTLAQPQLENSYLCETQFPSGVNLNPNRDCDEQWEPYI
ncbi:pentapeptide repeat-containing protein [Sphaerothrix gracilis]|uniref:pentapeptide repeat-containing protein n=1 Tax=Sphaerothrix gracilis TaxID=3151835 RepID=UPI0031FCA07E